MSHEHDTEDTGKFSDEDEIDLLSLFGILYRYRLLIIVLTLVAAVAAFLFSVVSLMLPPEKSYLPNRYRGQALILIQAKESSSISSMLSSSSLGSLAGLAGIESGSSYGELAVKLLRSKSILDPIIGKYNLIERYDIEKYIKANSRKELLENSRFEYDSNTNTVAISFEDYDPEFARDVTNSMVDLLDQRFAGIGGNRNITRKNLLEAKLVDVTAEMAALEARIRDFQEKHGVLTVEELATAQISALAELRSKLILKEMEIKTYSDFSRINDPVLKRMKSERDNLLRLIREVEGGYSSYEKLMPTQKELPELALQFARMKRDLFVQQKIYEILTQQYELAKLSLEAEEPVFQVLELAEVPDKKSGPSRSIICIITTLGAFFFSVILAFVFNAIRNIKNDPDKVRKLKGLSE
jgi:uncharacterized protein involved in exopolysaccharide biosynthesis